MITRVGKFRLLSALARFVVGGDKASFLDAFDLGHATVVDGDLNRTEAEIGHILANDFQPIGRCAVRGRRFRGGRFHGDL